MHDLDDLDNLDIEDSEDLMGFETAEKQRAGLTLQDLDMSGENLQQASDENDVQVHCSELDSLRSATKSPIQIDKNYIKSRNSQRHRPEKSRTEERK